MASIHLRPLQESDRHWILDSYLKTYGRSAYAEGVPGHLLIDLMEPLLIAWDVSVAVSADDPAEALGWIVYKAPDRVAWLFVKPVYRRSGVAKALLYRSGVGKFVSAPFVPTRLFGEPFQRVATARGYRVRFRPYLHLMPTVELASEEA